MIGPAIPELKYVHKFRLIDGHGVEFFHLGCAALSGERALQLPMQLEGSRLHRQQQAARPRGRPAARQEQQRGQASAR